MLELVEMVVLVEVAHMVVEVGQVALEILLQQVHHKEMTEEQVELAQTIEVELQEAVELVLLVVMEVQP